VKTVLKDRIKEDGNGHAAAVEQVTIAPLNMRTIELKIIGTAPYLQARFPAKAMQQIMAKQAAGDKANKNRARKARDFDADYEDAKHVMTDGKLGIPASAFRAAAISACRIAGFKMTVAKLSVFIEPDGYDRIDGTPLVKIIGEPKKHESIGRNENGSVDIRIRAIWTTWSAALRVRFDANQFSTEDVVNLFNRVGQQVGIGEGRADSRNSAGIGMGFFKVEASND
jgi:hypothetical protein